MPQLIPGYHREVARFDEIWTASGFVRDAFRPETRAPVVVVPPVVEPVATGLISREDLAIPRRACVFLFHFDANSTIARKNPFGVIRAFKSAFSDDERGSTATLVIKALNLVGHREARRQLRTGMQGVHGRLIEEEMSSGEVASLIELCDVYVSLHRSEGFGLGIAEAMALGKPVVATDYSGNRDYLSHANGVPIPFTLREISRGDLYFNPDMTAIYRAGGYWAEPNLDRAAKALRGLAIDPESRERLGIAARTTMVDRYSEKVVGRAIRERLEECRKVYLAGRVEHRHFKWHAEKDRHTREIERIGVRA
jgi:glycosyltransferase involved in cell wall biosynthesis